MKKGFLVFFAILFFIASGIIFAGYYFLNSFYLIDISDSLSVVDSNKDSFTLKISGLENDISCGHLDKGKTIVTDWVKTSNNECLLKVDSNIDKVYLKKYNLFTKGFDITDLVIGDNLPKKIYLALNDSVKINPDLTIIGDKKKIVYQTVNKNIAVVNKGKVYGKKVGKTKVKMTVNDKYTKEFEVEVTNLITKRPKKFNNNKPNLPCNKYTKEQAQKLDYILKSKIESVGGYGTRAAVVEAIRFLMLDFPYQVEYFFENGRVDGGMHNADGEGRYYHKGLYLHEYKFKYLKYSYAGPAIWGCPLKNFEDWGTVFKKGQYKPNGLDCSGFVSWSIVNGGYDPGDKGAGDNLEDTNEINDIGGEKADTSVELFKSGKVKAGDLLGIWGHIAIIAGIDDEHVYVAESLWTFGGPVINTYTFEEATKEFVQTVLLDDYYEKDGLYTDMWY